MKNITILSVLAATHFEKGGMRAMKGLKSATN